MVKNWDTYTRQGLDLVSSAASIGFSVAKTGTKIGVSNYHILVLGLEKAN